MPVMTLYSVPTCSHQFHDFAFAPAPKARCGGARQRQCMTARLDVIEFKDKYDILIDVPGFGPDDVSVTVEDGVLVIIGSTPHPSIPEEKAEEHQGKMQHSPHERRRMGFERQLALPDDADESTIHASQKDGVLTISVGKALPPETRVRHILVTSEDGANAAPIATGAEDFVNVACAGAGDADPNEDCIAREED